MGKRDYKTGDWDGMGLVFGAAFMVTPASWRSDFWGTLSCGLVAFGGCFRIFRKKGKVFVFVFALQDTGFGGARPAIGGFYLFADTVCFIESGAVGQHYGKEVEYEHQAGRCLVPQCVGDAFAGRQQLVAQPADFFPECLSAATGITDFNRQTVDVLPERTFGSEVAANLDYQWCHEAYLCCWVNKVVQVGHLSLCPSESSGQAISNFQFPIFSSRPPPAPPVFIFRNRFLVGVAPVRLFQSVWLSRASRISLV